MMARLRAWTPVAAILALLQAPSASAAAIEAVARISPDTLEVGQAAEYVLELRLPGDSSDPAMDWDPAPFEILSTMRPERRAARGGEVTESRRFLLATYQLENGAVPPPRIRVMAGGDTLAVSPETLRVAFRSVLAPGDTALAALKPPRDLPRRFPWLLAAAALAATALAAAAIVLRKRLRRRVRRGGVARPIPVPVDTRPAHVIAFEELDRLEARRLPQQGRLHEYCSALSEILRRYLGRRFGFDAVDSTSAEILEALAARPASREDRDLARSLLSDTDWVKFAKGRPQLEDAVALLGDARRFVERTLETTLAATGSGS
jgi:hypothetical protein